MAGWISGFSDNPIAQWVYQMMRGGQQNQWSPNVAYAQQPGFIGPVNPNMQNAASQQQGVDPQYNNFLMNYAYRMPTNLQAQYQAMMAQGQQPTLAQLYQQAGLSPDGTPLGGIGVAGAAGAGLPDWNFSQWGGSGSNPLANVPTAYWDYALGSQDRSLAWNQQQDYNRWKGEEMGLSRDQLDLQRQQARDQAAQWLAQYNAGNKQNDFQNNLAQGQFDWSKNTWGQEFNRATGNDSWARSNDTFNQALAAAQNDWQKRNAAEQLKVQDQGNALAAWGRRTNPLISSM